MTVAAAGPQISVVLPVYNGEDFLREAVQSVLRQSFSDLELLVVDDGSTDATPEILASFDDSRLHVIRNPRNIGIARSRNKALEFARGEFIAVHDHDDLSAPDRMQKELDFLRGHPAYVAVSCHYVLRVEGQPGRIIRLPADDLPLRWPMLFHTPLPHAGMMTRTSSMQAVGGYDESFPCTLDYDLQCRLARIGRLRNLPEELLLVNQRRSGITISRSDEQERNRQKISEREIGLLLGQGPVSAREREYAEVVFRGKLPRAREVRQAVHFSLKLADTFRQEHNCPEFISDMLSEIVAKHVRMSKGCLVKGKWKQALVRWWGAMHLLTSGLIQRPSHTVLKALGAQPGEDGDTE